MRIITVFGLMALTALLQGCLPIIAAGFGTTVLMAQDRRTNGAIIEDQGVELKALERIGREKREGVHINITSYNRKVLISGEVPSEAVKKEIGQIVAGVENVRMVNNELVVGLPSSISQRGADSITTSNVKLRLVQEKKVQADHVKVVTEAGTVFLMGMVSHSEAEIAAEVARTSDGVARVVKLFEYQD